MNKTIVIIGFAQSLFGILLLIAIGNFFMACRWKHEIVKPEPSTGSLKDLNH